MSAGLFSQLQKESVFVCIYREGYKKRYGKTLTKSELSKEYEIFIVKLGFYTNYWGKMSILKCFH